MTLSGLLDAVVAEPALARVLAAARAGEGRYLDTSLDVVAPPALRPFLAAALASDADGCADRSVVAVTATGREAADLTAALSSLLPPEQVAEFPAWETLPHERLSPRSDTVGRRLAVLRRLRQPDPADPGHGPIKVVVAPVSSLLQPIVAGLGETSPVSVAQGHEIDLDELVTALVDVGYARVDLVENRGDLAVRGGIVDVFPPTEEHPLRCEFWGDTVEEIRYFSVADQRTLQAAGAEGASAPRLWAPPCRELLLTPQVRERARALSAAHAGQPAVADILGRLAEGIPVEGMEAFAPVLADGMELLLDYLPPGGYVLACDPERIRTRAAELVRTSQEFLEASWANAAAGGPAPIEAPLGGAGPIDLGAAAYKSIAEVRADARALGLGWWTITPFTPTDGSAIDPDLPDERPIHRDGADDGGPVSSHSSDGSVVLGARAAEPYRGDTQRFLSDIKGWLHEDWRVVLVTEGHGPAERLIEVLRDEGIGARLDEDLRAAPDPAVVHVCTGPVHHGFAWPDLRLAVLTETDLAGQRASTKDMRRLPSRRRAMVDPLQLRPGDYVVHEQHGVGRYVEMARRTTRTAGGAAATREYLVIEYAAARRGQPGDRLYVPTDQLDLVTRYVGGEAPTLHRLGGSDWAKAKGRARKAVRQIAAELIRLYSARTATPGHAFDADTPWQHELEDAFGYVETPDQVAAIDEVKGDMEKPVPMDRLICGDVGYGKTEIAVRAAFKAVQDGRQVAVLCPTTLLTQQHYTTFTERYANFPVIVKAFSRFQTDREAAEVRQELTGGTVDVVIGTHRLLSPETRFKNLGLVVVDEEQRFGVEHKEYLKHLRTQVDVLSLSATPIPRTLEMGLTGIREMSTILTPPEERHPVLTFVGPYDENQIAAAVRRELMREGQVFYLHNRVASIDRVASRVRALVPEARVGIAHGQMPEHQLERVMVDFWEKAYDVLVCTTIVESGLDIPNANTLIVDRADAFGLSQLHQIRGRVGRGRERAYAYFTYPPDRPLTETAHERLATLAQHTEMGAGMYVATKDLEIRGAGNILGAEQSGHIAGVGFDLYVRMVGEAVAEFKDEGEPERPETKVELPVDAHIPHDYVPGERLRLEAYRRIAGIDSDDGVYAVREELTDRYGTPPPPVDNLLEVARFRARARRAGLSEVTLQGNQVRFSPVELPESARVRLQRLYPRSVLKPAVRTLLVPAPRTASIGGRTVRDLDLLKWCTEVIDSVLDHRPRPALSGDR